MGLGYDPSDARITGSGFTVKYAVTTTGDPGFLPAYAQTSGGAASDTSTALAVKADRLRMCQVIAPEYVESAV